MVRLGIIAITFFLSTTAFGIDEYEVPEFRECYKAIVKTKGFLNPNEEYHLCQYLVPGLKIRSCTITIAGSGGYQAYRSEADISCITFDYLKKNGKKVVKK